MKKMEYRRPTADLILFENEDIVMTSGESGFKCYPWPGHLADSADCECAMYANYCHKCHGWYDSQGNGHENPYPENVDTKQYSELLEDHSADTSEW